MERFLSLKKLGRLFGFFFIFTNICFAEVVNNSRLDVDKIFFTQVDKVGNKLFAVGEHGIILSSIKGVDDWMQHHVGYKGLFTSFDFSSPDTGLFVGHDSVLFRTENGGKSFEKILIDMERPVSFMKVQWLSKLDALIVGDFGSVFYSSDGGRTWQKELIVDKNFDRHLYDILVSKHGVFIIGESGWILFKKKKSNKWVQIDVPYSGSYFGGVIHNNQIYFFGMRGNIISTSLDFFAETYTSQKSIIFNHYITPSKLGIMSAGIDEDGSLIFFSSGGIAYELLDGFFVSKEALLDTVVSTVDYGNFTVFAGLKGIKISD